MAALIVYGMYHEQIVLYQAAVEATGQGPNTLGGAASIFCAFPAADQSLGYLFLIEFMVDSYIVRSHTILYPNIEHMKLIPHRDWSFGPH